MKEITATVVWSVGVKVNVPDNATDDESKDAIIEEALRQDLDFKNPCIHECSDENLID